MPQSKSKIEEYIEVLPQTDFSFSMIQVEGGEFEMGHKLEVEEYSEEVIHPVSLDTFYIGKFPVTQALWKAVMGAENNPSFFSGDQRPIESVSWEEVQGFIQALSTITLRNYRLPTEAEWEYAARGAKQSKEYIYAGSNELEDVGWYFENSHGETKAVGQKFPNELGLYDMTGNVDEWCADWFSDKYYQVCADQGTVHNPAGPAEGSDRVLRGGGWSRIPRDCRSAFRDSWVPDDRFNDIGFRLAFSLQ